MTSLQYRQVGIACVRIMTKGLRDNRCEDKYAYICSSDLTGTHTIIIFHETYTGLILGLHPASERRGYCVTTSPNGWVQA